LHVAQDPVMLTLSAYADLTFGFPDAKDIDNRRVAWILDKLGLTKVLALCRDELSADHGPEAPAPGEPHDTDTSWQNHLTGTEQSLLHLARALIMNPEVLVLQRPLHRLNGQLSMRVRDMLMDHVKHRGLCLPASEREQRRPRTMIYTADDAVECQGASIVWMMKRRRAASVAGQFAWGVTDASTQVLGNQKKGAYAPEVGEGLPRAGSKGFPVRPEEGRSWRDGPGLKGEDAMALAFNAYDSGAEFDRRLAAESDPTKRNAIQWEANDAAMNRLLREDSLDIG